VTFPSLRGFYRDLGWPQIVDDDQFAAFDLRGVVVALFPLAQLARDGNTEPDLVQRRHPLHHRDHGRRSGGSRSAGRANAQRRARVTKEPIDAEFFTGRSAYLCDPEGSYYEITWAEPDNPITSRRTARA
jgi:uncharacterized protein